MTPDPLSEKYYGVSPYAFCNNNPVNFVDPDGRVIGTASDLISLGLGIRSFIQNIKAGNTKEAILDGVGVAFDLAAVAIPVMPGGVGYLRQGARLVNYADLAVDAAKLTGDLQNFEKAAEFGVDSYKNLRKSVVSTYGAESGLEVRHLVEKRFANTLGIKGDDIPSVVLTKEEHKKFTAAWRKAIGYKNSGADITTTSANKEEILEAAKNIYKDYPELLKAIEEIFK